MKIEFNLAFEDYLEWQSTYFRRKRSNTSLIVALVGFLSFGLGYAILRSSPETNSFLPGGALLLVGLLTTVGAIPVWFLGSQRKPEKTRAYLLSEFDRFYAERRSWEADETGWIFTYGTAINKRQWAELLRVRESHRTFILADTFASYVLPKSTLSNEQQRELRGLLDRSLIQPRKLWSVSMISSSQDYARAMVIHNWSKVPWAVVSLYALGLVFALLMALILADRLVVLGILAFVLFAGLLYFAQQWYYGRSFEVDYIRRTFQRVDILEDGVCFRADSGLSVVTGSEIRKIRYRWISDIRETKRSFMLYVSPRVFYLIPKAGFTLDQLTQFQGFLRNREQGQALDS
jgi:hypothetical protein